MADVIPQPDNDFNDFAGTLNTAVNDPANPLQLTPAQIAAYNAAFAQWTVAWPAYVQATPAFNKLLTAKDTSRASMDTAARTINNTVQANPAVPAAAKSAAGLPVHKETRTPVAPIETHPVLYKVENEHLLQRLWFSDSATPGKKAKPPGAAMCEIREQIVPIGGAAPTDPNTMLFLANETKPPHRNDLSPADVGKTAYYAQRWINTAGDPGPWSPITSYPIT